MDAHWLAFATSGVIGGSFLNSLPFPWVIFREDLSLCVLFVQCLLNHVSECPCLERSTDTYRYLV